MPAPHETEADLLARDLYQARCQLQEAGRILHDQAGTLLSAAGIQLQLLRLDHPQTAGAIDETLGVLDQATESVRALSRKLDPSPAAHLGLARALAQLAEEHAPAVSVSHTATSKLPAGATVAIYETILAALSRAGEAAVRITVRGSGHSLAVRMTWKGHTRWPRPEITALARRLLPAGVVLDVTTKEGTIVSIRYAPRRTARR